MLGLPTVVVTARGAIDVMYSQTIDPTVYDLDSIKQLADACGILLQQEANE